MGLDNRQLRSRERVSLALTHTEPDMIPLDLGGFEATGIHVTTVYKLRQALGLDAPGVPVKVVEPYMMLGEIKADLADALGIDVAPVRRKYNIFGFENTDWRPWQFREVPVLVPSLFVTTQRMDGSLLIYPQGDRSAAPSGVMPSGGYYFDSTIRQDPIDDQLLKVEDNLEEFSLISDQELGEMAAQVEDLYQNTDRALMANFGGTSFGDIALVPGPMLKHPRGIRDVEEWYVSLISRRDHIYKIFERQCEIGLKNLNRVFGAVGNKVSVVVVTGADLGMQTGLFLRPEVYRDLFKPFHGLVNAWIHKNTNWKTFIHTCGSVVELLDDLIEVGFDVLNPVQCSAAGMEPTGLKRRFGDKIVFWGGGIDPRTLQFGNAKDVEREVTQRVKSFKKGGGFVFSSIHNIQPNVPTENLLTLINTFRDCRAY